MIPTGARGTGGRLCPWSRCLTWAKPAKQPPVRGEPRNVSQGRGVRQQGQDTAGTVHRGSMSSKTNHRLHFPTQNIVCLSVLPLSPVSTSTCQQSAWKCFCSVSFSVFLPFSTCVHRQTIHSHTPSSLFLPPHPITIHTHLFQEGKRGIVCSRF